MGTLNGLFDSARNALQADQLAIETTGQNIQNQNTAGYARRSVTWTEKDTVRIGGNNAGLGATATVSAQRDTVLDRGVQQATDAAAASSTRLSALQKLEGLFTLDSTGNDSSGINTALSGFFTALSSAAADPTNPSATQGVTAAAQTVANTLNRTSSQLNSQQAALNQQVSTGVQQINSLLPRIAKLNGEIGRAGAADTANLQDQRTALISQLSQFVGVQQAVAQNNTLTISTGNGTLLVGGDQAYALSAANVAGSTRVYAPASQGGAEITAQLQGGSISGAMQARDGDLTYVQSQLDMLAYTFATAVNGQNQAGQTSRGTAGSTIFTIGPTVAGSAAAVALGTGATIATAAVGEASGGNGNANALLALQLAGSIGGQSFSGSFSSLLSGLGTRAAEAKATSAADTANATQLSTQRDQLSGVSLDTEAANLAQYQRSYQASAKLLSILNSLMATAINIGTNTPVQ